MLGEVAVALLQHTGEHIEPETGKVLPESNGKALVEAWRKCKRRTGA